MSRPIGISGLVLSVLFVGCWSAGFVGVRLGTEHAGFVELLLWRSVVLCLLLALPLVAALRHLPRRELGRQVVVGALSQAAYLLSVYGAIGLGVSSGTTALIDGIQPLVVGALAGPLLGAAVARREWLGLGLGMAGVVVVTAADLTSPASTAPWWAYLVPLLGMGGLVAATFVERRAPRRTPALQALAVHCATTAVVAVGAAVVQDATTGGGGSSLVPPLTAGFWWAIAWLVVLATFGGYGLYWLLLERRGVTSVNTLLFLVPPVTAVWGAAWFGEPFGPVTALGLALALVAVRLAGRVGRAPADESRGEAGSEQHDHRQRSPERGAAAA